MADAPQGDQGTPIISEDLANEWEGVDLMLPGGVEQPTTDEKTDEAEEEVETPAAPDDEPEIEYVQDPGEYVPADYSFEVTTYDDEGKNPEVHEIKSADEWDKLLNKEPNFGSGAALMKAQKLATRMELKAEQDHAEWKKQKDAYDKVASEDNARTERITEMQKEMDYLVARGDLPKLTKKQVEANWNDPEVAKQDGIKEHLAVLRAAEKESADRAKAGLSPKISLIDAFNNMKPKTETAPKPSAGAQRQAEGARIAAGAANPVSSAPKGVSVGRGGSLDDLGKNWF